MASRRVQIGETGETVRDRVKSIRKGKGLTLSDVSQRVDDLGRSLKTSTLFDIENGGRRVDVDDLVVIAAALGVSPIRLLMPDTTSWDDSFTVAGVGSVAAIVYWDWLRANYPLLATRGTETDPDRPAPDASVVLQFQLDSRPGWAMGELDPSISLQVGRNT